MARADTPGDEARTIETVERLERLLEAMHAVAEAGGEADGARLLPALARIAAGATESASAAIYLIDPERGDMTLAASHGADAALVQRYSRIPLTSIAAMAAQSLEARAVSAGELSPAVSREVVGAGAHEFALVPLQVKGWLAGALALSRAERRRYAPDELRAAERLADQMTIQIEKARLHDDSRRRVRQLSLLVDLARLGAGPPAVAPLVDHVLDRVLDALGVDSVMIHLVADGKLALAGHRRRDPAGEDPTPWVGSLAIDASTVSGRAALRRETVFAGVADWPSGTAPVARRLGGLHATAAPLIASDELVGTLCAVRREDLPYSADDVQLLETCAAHLAQSIDHARLFDALRESYQKLEGAQQKLVERERLAALGELAASVAHEVRNPLGSIFNSLSSLRKLVGGVPDAGMLVEIAAEEASRLNRIVGELLDFARPMEPQLVRQPIGPVVHGASAAVLGALGERAEGRISIEVDRGLPEVRFDAEMLRQALINLMVNALQASQPSGEVSVRARAESRAGRRSLRLDVTNAGAGIPPAVAGQIFQPFFTTKPTGTGLGLAIVKRIVEAHRGEVAFESGDSRGTTFTLRIPVDAA